MSNRARKSAENDMWTWVVIGMIYGAVILALWAPLIWQSVHG